MTGRLRAGAARLGLWVERARALVDRALRGAGAGKTQIVICGYPRSGTSLLYNMLAVALPGFHNDPFEAPAGRRIWRYDDWITKLPHDVFAVESLVAANVHGKRLYVVVPIRDFRDVVTSVHPNVPGDYFIGWERGYRVGLSEGSPPTLEAPGIGAIAAQLEGLRDRVGFELVFVSYEELVRDPDSVGKQLERILGLRFEHPLSSFHRHAEAHPYRYDEEHTAAGADRSLMREQRPTDPERVGRWRDATHRERVLREFGEHAGLRALLCAHGYEPGDAWLRDLGGEGDAG